MQPIYCKGCHQIIQDRYFLLVEPDLLWHLPCLRCKSCKRELEMDQICHVTKNGAYCTMDFRRLVSSQKTELTTNIEDRSLTRSSLLTNSSILTLHKWQLHCARCGSRLHSHDLICNVGRYLNFHYPQCLVCLICGKALKPGSSVNYVLGSLICSSHKLVHDHMKHLQELGNHVGTKWNASELPRSTPIWTMPEPDNLSNEYPNRWVTQSDNKSPDHVILPDPYNADVPMTMERLQNERFAEFSQCSVGKQSRMRTVLNERQLTALRTCYSVNPRPDTTTKEQLALVTGLNLRVIRVWFQNKRCKDKKCRAQSQSSSTTPDSTDSSSYFVIDYGNLDSDDVFLSD